jgi:DNA repair protein SbcC/Rad50
MLKKLKLTNYKSHRDSTIELSSGITGLIGESLSGKTNFVRAVKLVNENKPSGFKYHSTFAENDKTAIRITTDRKTIAMVKRPKSHTYKINGKLYRKLGRQVPDVVKQELNLGPINFQTQLSGPFLVLSSPGQVAKAISEVVNTSQIDTAIKAIRKKNSSISSEKKVLSNDIEKIQMRLDTLEVLDEIKPDIKKLKKIQSSIQDSREKIIALEEIEDQIKTEKENIYRITEKLKIKPLLRELDKIEYEIDAEENKKQLIDKIYATRSIIKADEIKVDKLKTEYTEKLSKEKKCPTCLGEINEDTINRIREDL